jgi:type II secretory pathway pseudopilin PulG
MKKYYIAIGILCLVCAATIVAYYVIFAGQVSDSVKVQDINSITTSIDVYASSNRKLPSALTDLKLDSPVEKRLSQYTYENKGTAVVDSEIQDRYQLCANFKSASSGLSDGSTDNTGSDYQSYIDPSSHAAGMVCYKLYSSGGYKFAD